MKIIDRLYESKYRYIPMLLLVLLGSAISGIAFNVFLIPNKLLSGGISGIALILNYLFGLNPGILIFVFNIPIFVLGYRFIDREFILMSLVGMSSFSASISYFSFLQEMIQIEDIMISCIFGGVLGGVGLGIIFRNRASQGGIDILAVIAKKYWSINLGSSSLIINFSIVAVASLFYGVKPAMYTLISMYVTSAVLDKVLQGFGTSKAVMIITDREQQVADEILKKLGRGVTYLEGEGAYTGNRKKVVYCIVSLGQLAKLKQIVKEIDANAFMAVNDTAEVLGYGFANRGI